jgi:acyl carrier protein
MTYNIDEIKAFLAAILEVEEEEIEMETDFVKDLDADSLMALEILATLEKKYKIKIPEEALSKMTNLQNVINIIEEIKESKVN